MSRSHRRRLRGALLLAVAAMILVIASGVTGTLSSWTQAMVLNSGDTTSTASLAFTHDYQSTSCALDARDAATIACAGSIAPTDATSASGGVTGTDAVTNSGTAPAARLSEQVSAASCAAVQLANAKHTTNPLLARYATGFQAPDPWGGSNAITLDGTSAYADAVVQQSQPTAIINLGTSYGWGVWFKTSTTGGGPLFGFTTNPANAGGGSTDHVLYMDQSGHVGFVYNTTPSSTGLSSSSFNDGAWHFAYVRITVTGVIVPLALNATVYVDGASAVSSSVLLSGLSSFNGYWHLGWSPISATSYGSGLSNYFAGSLSNFTAFTSSPAPAVPGTNPASQSAFDTFASSATEQWRLSDTGTTTFSGTFPVIGASSPCAMLDVAWAFTNPAGSATAATTLSTFADGTWHTVAAPEPGVTQTSSITLTRRATYDSYIAGLRLYVPLSSRVLTDPASGWSITFSWPDAIAALIA